MFPLRLMLHTLSSKYVLPPLTKWWFRTTAKSSKKALLAHQSSCFKLFLMFLASKKALKTALPLWREKRLSWLDTITKCEHLWNSHFFFAWAKFDTLRRYKVAIIIYTSCIPWTGLVWKTWPWGRANPSCNKHDENSCKHRQIGSEQLRFSKEHGLPKIVCSRMLSFFGKNAFTLKFLTIFEESRQPNTWLGFPGYKWDFPWFGCNVGFNNSIKLDP